jgi:hypothetical protein
MGLDARRGAGFPLELYEDRLQGWKTKPNKADSPLCKPQEKDCEKWRLEKRMCKRDLRNARISAIGQVP